MEETEANVINGMATIEVWRDASGLWLKQESNSLGEGEALIFVPMHAVPELLRAICEQTGLRHA